MLNMKILKNRSVQTEETKEPYTNQRDHYLDYFTCKEYNKKLIKKLNDISKNNDTLKIKVKDIKHCYDSDLNKKINDILKQVDEENELNRVKFENNRIRKSRVMDQKLVDELFKADTKSEIKAVGNKILKNMDQLLESKNKSQIKNEKLIDVIFSLKSENDRLKDLFEAINK